jgi:hypothetical protein
MKRNLAVFVLVLSVALALPFLAQAATTGTANVTLAAQATVQLSVLDPAITLNPSTTDYDNGYVDAAGASGIRVNVKSNSSTGAALLITCQDASPQVALADLLVRTQTAPQGGGTSIASYTPITAVNQTLWSSTTAIHGWSTVTTDVRIQNLMNYDDPSGPGVTDYTNTLTYSIILQ